MSTSERPALSRRGILDAAIAQLDDSGVRGLTLRGLAAKLGTGVGSIYWYVAGKDELIRLAADETVHRALEAAKPNPEAADPLAEVRRVSLALYEQLDEHPWASEHLGVGDNRLTGGLMLWELFAECLARTGRDERAQFYGVSALINYVVGVGRRMTTARFDVAGQGRGDFLGRAAAGWEALDPAEFPRTRAMAGMLAHHDDLEQFVTGLDLLVAGLRRPPEQSGP